MHRVPDLISARMKKLIELIGRQMTSVSKELITDMIYELYFNQNSINQLVDFGVRVKINVFLLVHGMAVDSGLWTGFKLFT